MTTYDQTVAGTEEQPGKISLKALAEMTGFPIEVIQHEIFKGDAKDPVSLEELRAAMLTFIDSTMLMSDEK